MIPIDKIAVVSEFRSLPSESISFAMRIIPGPLIKVIVWDNLKTLNRLVVIMLKPCFRGMGDGFGRGSYDG